MKGRLGHTRRSEVARRSHGARTALARSSLTLHAPVRTGHLGFAPLKTQGVTFRCSLGRNGVTTDKQEGDGKTPAGLFYLRRAFYRADRVPAPTVALDLVNATQENFGWCDDAGAPEYNTFVLEPFEPSHEDLWLSSSYYDLMAVIGWNDDPPVPGKGSAIFFHVTPDYGSTSGCVALALADLTVVLEGIDANTQMNITAAA